MPTPENTIDQSEIGTLQINIPLLAIEAADQLDDLALGQGTSSDAIESLADNLRRSFLFGEEGQAGFVDSGTVAVLCDAFNGFQPERQITTMEELIKRALEIVGELDAASAKPNITQLEKMRDFCIALSAAAASFRNSVYEQQPSHPFEA